MSASIDGDDSLDAYLKKEFPDISPPPSLINCLDESDSHPPVMIPGNNDASVSGFPLEPNADEDQSVIIQQAASFSTDSQLTSPRYLKVIAQPGCSEKVRYRNDYKNGSKRRTALINKNPNSNYKRPAISISSKYLDLTQQYFIGVSLILPMHASTGCYYLHPYELESIDHADYNDRSKSIVWYTIEEEDQNGPKSFPDLRVVRKTEEELEAYGNLRPFLYYDANLLNNDAQNALSKRKMVAEYQLKQAHLAFFIGKRINPTDNFPRVIDLGLTELSEEMTLFPDASTGSSAQPKSPPCNVYQYAPRYGYTDGNDLMLVFLTRKPNERINGKIQITFQSLTPNPEWSVTIDTAITVKEQMVSFRTPKFSEPISTPTRVHVVLRQKNETIGTLDYQYISKSQCATCQKSTTDTRVQFPRTNSNKRLRLVDQMYHEENDAMVPISPSTPKFQSTISVPESNSSNTSPEPLLTSTKQTDIHENQLSERLHTTIESLFIENDFKPLFRLCRPSIKKNPKFLYTAIDNNYSDLVSKFIPVAGIEIMQKQNEHGETALLQAVRLNRLQIVKAALERKEADQLLEDTDDKERNIFHILALNTNSDELLDLIIDHLLKQSTDIFKKFDQMDEDHHTPLQLAVLNNNLPFARRLLKYFNTNISHSTGENLIHLAVRQGDLELLKYLLNEGKLIEQGNQTSLSMTPFELAQSLNHIDMMNYLNELYPKPEIIEEENSDTD